jgi:hypothetical protein
MNSSENNNNEDISLDWDEKEPETSNLNFVDIINANKSKMEKAKVKENKSGDLISQHLDKPTSETIPVIKDSPEEIDQSKSDVKIPLPTEVKKETKPVNETSTLTDEKESTTQRPSPSKITSKEKWIRNTNKIRTSKKVLLPGIIISSILIFLGQYSEAIVSHSYTPEEILTLPNFLQNNLKNIIKYGFYGVSAFLLVMSFKAKNKGTLGIYDAYVLHKKGMFDKKKILLAEIVSIDIHFSPFSPIGDIGNLEISSRKGDIYFYHCPHPNEVKEKIITKMRDFSRN